MKASTRWIAEILGSEIDARSVADRLTQGGVEIEEVIHVPAPDEGLVLARVTGKKAHPERGNLSVVDVDDGRGTHQVVCGAPNCPGPGGLVVYARPGTVLGEDRRIGHVEIRGVASAGMLCSETEMGIGPDEDGILVLDGDVRVGSALRDLDDFEDDLLEFTITPNRPDCLGHLGLAREVAAVMGMDFDRPGSSPRMDLLDEKVTDLASVRIEDPSGCPRYAAAVVQGVTISPSPLWLRNRLHVLGVRPISNIVDVTNWILLYDNQPLHAFDLRLLPDGEIIVRRAERGEPIVTLDGVDRELLESDLVIASRERPVAVAGVMGGEGTAITDDTTDVLIECAYFDPDTIRHTSARLHLMSESSYRFERGTDPSPLPEVVTRAASMMSDLGGGKVAQGIIDEHPAPQKPSRLRFRVSRADLIVGTTFQKKQCVQALQRLGCEVETLDDEGTLDVTVPTHRPDLTREIDLVEEVARLRGYDTIQSSFPRLQVSKPQRALYDLVLRFKRALAAEGLDEVVTLSFASSRELESLGYETTAVPLENPLSTERDVMRTSLLPGLLDLLCYHTSRSRNPLRVFEVGTVFWQGQGGVVEGVVERRHAAGLMFGPRPSWISEERGQADFHDACGALTGAARQIWQVEPTLQRMEEPAPWLHPRSACQVLAGDLPVGWIGELHPRQAQRMDVPRDRDGLPLPVGIFEIHVTSEPEMLPRYEPFSDMPISQRDLALIFPADVAAGRIRDVVNESAGDLLEEFRVFDVFSGEGKIPQGYKSIAFSLTMRAHDRTLTQAEVDEVVEKVVRELGAKLDGKVRE